MKALFLGAVVVLALSGMAQAQRFSNLSGGKLVEYCSSSNRAAVEACTAYVDGVSDTASFYQFLLPADGSKGQKLPDYICVPGPTTGPQLRETVVGWARRHPDALRDSAAKVTMRALNDTYPCQGEQRRP